MKLSVGFADMVGIGDVVGPGVAIVGTDGAMVEVGWAVVGVTEPVGPGVNRVGATEGAWENVGEGVGLDDVGPADGANEGTRLGEGVVNVGCNVGTSVVAFSPLSSTRVPRTKV